MKFYAFSLLVFTALVALLAISVSHSNSQQISPRYDYFDVDIKQYAGEFWSLGKTSSGTQVFIRRGSVYGFMIGPNIEAANDDWMILVFYGSRTHRFYFKNEEDAVSSLAELKVALHELSEPEK